MKTAQIIAAEYNAADAADVAEGKAIAKDQCWGLEMTKYTFDDNSVLAIRNTDVFGFDADSAESIRDYAAWLGGDIDEAEGDEVERLLEAVEE